MTLHDILEKEFTWCENCIAYRIQQEFNDSGKKQNYNPLHSPPTLTSIQISEYRYLGILSEIGDTPIHRLGLILALAPLIRPHIFDVLLHVNERTPQSYNEFSCLDQNGVIWATGHTLAYLLGGRQLQTRLEVMALISPPQEQSTELKGHDKRFYDLLDLSDHNDSFLPLWHPLKLTPQTHHECLTNTQYISPIKRDFPATLLSTTLSWNNVVLSESVKKQLEDIRLWLSHGETLQTKWGMLDKIRPGFRVLFYGPSGTGKTLTASLLGKRTNKQVYRVNISSLISKYIGETEKNLDHVFQQAEANNWLLFFDEADALFGQRVKTSGANDQFVNQNIAYLLQRIETFTGVIILATNLKDNMDEAFFRRFESSIYFPLPNAQARLQIWQQAIPPLAQMEEGLELKELAQEHNLSGSEIHNVIRQCSLKAIERDSTTLTRNDLQDAIQHNLTINKTSPHR